MSRRKRIDWTFVNSRTGEAECRRCGEHELIPLPMPISAFVSWVKYFNDRHSECEEALRAC